MSGREVQVDLGRGITETEKTAQRTANARMSTTFRRVLCGSEGDLFAVLGWSPTGGGDCRSGRLATAEPTTTTPGR